jgi:uncharacterized protein (TIGR02099 family)
MLTLLKKLLKTVAYMSAAVVIFLALAVGLFRLMLPRLPEYQEEIKDWANAAIGMQVEFSGMNARWRLSGPELTFTDAQLTAIGAEESLLTAQEVSVGVNFMRLLSDRELVADRISIRDTEIDVRHQEAGDWLVEGMAVDDLIGSRAVDSEQASEVLVDIRDLRINLHTEVASDVIALVIESLEVDRNDRRTRINADIGLPDEFGGRLNVTASQRSREVEQGIWRLSADARALNLARWSSLNIGGMPEIASGFADLSVSMQRSAAGWDNAAVDFVLSDLAGPEAGSMATFAARGHLEYASELGGWMLAANRFVLSSVDGDWPETGMQVRPRFSASGDLSGLSVSSSFLNFNDLRYMKSWLPVDSQTLADKLALSGVVRDLNFDVSALDSDAPRFNVAAELADAGIAARDGWPGIRGFSGRVRADSAGGRLEIASTDMMIDLQSQLAEPIAIDDAAGTIIWRANADGTTILSDSVRIRNAEFDSQSSLQVTLPTGGGSPIVDLQSDWSINDIGAAPRYLPAKSISPVLYRWLTAALVAGRIPRATTRFFGPLDKFPFDNGEGEFRVDAELVNGRLRYSDKWPVAQNMNMHVTVENARLYSVRNSATNAGNTVVDARIEIADLRKPVLTIDAFATGSLDSIRAIAMQSPIAGIFGGHLNEVSVGGDASFNLDLRLPILDRENYEFSTRIRTSDGILQFEGFPPAITELNGTVTVTRDEITAESLFGVFLGEHIDIKLARTDQSSQFTAIAEIDGSVSAMALSEAFDIPMNGVLQGVADYHATVQFPRSNQDQKASLQIIVDSGLQGVVLALPEPLAKPAESEMPLSLTLKFPGDGSIESIGSLTDSVKWTLDFTRIDEKLDFDRGAIAVGGAYPDDPPTRGLHIVGQTGELHLRRWLDVASRGDGRFGIAERVRSLDLAVDNLYLIGQHLTDQRIIVQRGALDWFVQLSGVQNVGAVTVPFEFSGGRPLIVDMEKLTLPGSDEPATKSTMDPRLIPPMQVRATEFSLGERNFGSLTADFVRTPDGIESSNLETADESFTISGNARWVADVQNETGQRTDMQVTISSTNVQETMRQLDYQPGIKSKDMQVDLDVSWSGGPRQDLFASLNGDVTVRLGAGQLEEVEPGAGRVFGLMSVVALPRRLSLDFSDVFDRGFGFDEITGTFRLEDGQAYTCDLSLEGPAADVGVVGQASLVERTYDQTVIVSGNLGNTLPVVAAVVAGPQVAAALLIFSQIFKKPLQGMGQIYYGIEGSWDEPDINPADSKRFAMSSELADCIKDAKP